MIVHEMFQKCKSSDFFHLSEMNGILICISVQWQRQKERKMKNRSYRHWFIVFLMCCLAASSVGLCINAVGVFYGPVSESLGTLRGTFTLHATLQSLALAGITLVLPKIFYRYSYRKMLWIGVLMASISTFLMGLSSSVWHFYILGIIRGIGMGLFNLMPVTIIISNWFEEKHGLATSIALSFSGLAGAVFSPLISGWITAYGWQVAYMMKAACIFACTLPALLIPWTIRPEDCGLEPYGYNPETYQKPTIKTSGFNLLRVSFICMCVFAVLQTALSSIAQHLSSLAGSIGLSASVGAILMSMSMIGNISTKLLIGILSDKIGPVNACISMNVVNVISLIMMIFGITSQNTVVLMAASILFGSIFSVGAVGISLLTRHFFGVENYSITYSKINFLTSIGGSIALTLIGYAYDFTGTYLYVMFASIAIHVFNLFLLQYISKRVKTEDA